MSDLIVFGKKCANGDVKIYHLEGRFLRYKCTFPAGRWTPDNRKHCVYLYEQSPFVWLPAEEKKAVKIEVFGGVAECTEASEGVSVKIIDHDNIAAEKAMTPAERRKWKS